MLTFYRSTTGQAAAKGEAYQDDFEMIEYITAAYTHVINRNESLDAGELAARITRVYSTENPRNRAVVNTLQRYSKQEA
jgi:hypothetical protein